MNYSGDRILLDSQRESQVSRFRPWVLFVIPLLAILFTAGLYVSGLFVLEMRTFHSEEASQGLQTFLRGLSYVLPNFENFNVMGAVVHGRGVPAAMIWHATLYAILYLAIVLTGAAIVFSRRNLK